MRDPVDHPSPGKPVSIGRLKRRADFVHVGKGRRWHGKALTMQAAFRDQSGGSDGAARVGITLTKKVGCAVIRNRARRRLREAIRLSPDLPVRPDHDYVVIGRADALRVSFAALKDEVRRATCAVHDGGSRSKRRPASPSAEPNSVKREALSECVLERIRPEP